MTGFLDLLYLDECLCGMEWDAKYAGDDNFTGSPVDGYAANRIVVTRAIAEGLGDAADRAAKEDLHLLIYDAVRPARAVRRFVAWSRAPEDGVTKARFYPNAAKSELFALGYIAEKSSHCFGGAVDLTLTDAQGRPLSMGGEFDLMDARSHHGAMGLSEEQESNRKKLRLLMESCGFSAYENEWWHYSLPRERQSPAEFDFAITRR